VSRSGAMLPVYDVQVETLRTTDLKLGKSFYIKKKLDEIPGQPRHTESLPC
jgi:hypothetical protein